MTYCVDAARKYEAIKMATTVAVLPSTGRHVCETDRRIDAGLTALPHFAGRLTHRVIPQATKKVPSFCDRTQELSTFLISQLLAETLASPLRPARSRLERDPQVEATVPL